MDTKLAKDKVITANSYIAFSGRVNNQKGFDLIIDAMNLLEAKYPDNKILPLFAAGQLDSVFINQFKIPGSIHFQGILPKEEMDNYYRNARFLVFCSRSYEGAPMVFLEAMKHHLPIIAPRLGAYPEMIEDGINGLLFCPEDPVDLADKINILMSNEELCFRLGENGHRKLTERYSPEIHYEQLFSLYNQVIEETSL